MEVHTGRVTVRPRLLGERLVPPCQPFNKCDSSLWVLPRDSQVVPDLEQHFISVKTPDIYFRNDRGCNKLQCFTQRIMLLTSLVARIHLTSYTDER